MSDDVYLKKTTEDTPPPRQKSSGQHWPARLVPKFQIRARGANLNCCCPARPGFNKNSNSRAWGARI